MKRRIEDIYINSAQIINEGDKVEGNVRWQSPSNIALVKYWGKHGVQLPANPSLSLSLCKSYTETEITYSNNKEGSELNFSFKLDGQENKLFSERIGKFLESVKVYFPFLSQLKLVIQSKNTFPHTSGIASSASAYSALSLCLCTIERNIFSNYNDEKEFEQKASYFARLGSGSASRSVFGGIVSWGKNKYLSESSDLYASDISELIHPVFKTYQNSILIIDSGQKKVSSSLGHSLMNNHPFASRRFEQANDNYGQLINVMKEGNISGFIRIVENEAMSLHAMMMTSEPWFILMTPESLKVISAIREFRNKSDVPVCFTLDAGPNIHLLYPEEYSVEVTDFINSLISDDFIIQNVIFDAVGKGPIEIH